MGASTGVAGKASVGRRSRSWGVRHRVTGWLLLLGCLLLVVATVFLGERHSTFDQLRVDVQSGAVTAVRVTEGLGGTESRGYTVVEVHWRRGAFAYTTTVIEARPLRAARNVSRVGVTAVIDLSVGTTLKSIDPDVEVRPTHQASSTVTALGRTLPTWLFLPTLLVTVGTVIVLVRGPDTWRATPWAWFWLLWVGWPLGTMAYLVLGGPTGLVREPAPGARRMTGGWTFLFSLALGSAIATLVQS